MIQNGENMKLKPNIDMIAFFEAVKHCKGEVLFKTDEGDTLNLNSTLSQFIFVTIMETRDFLTNGIIECMETDDIDILNEYLLPI